MRIEVIHDVRPLLVSELTNFMGRTAYGEIEGVLNILLGLKEEVGISTSKLASMSEFYKECADRMAHFYRAPVTDKPTSSTGDIKEAISGKPALMDYFSKIKTYHDKGAPLSEIDVKTLKTFNWCFPTEERLTIDKLVSDLIKQRTHAMLTASALTDAGKEGEVSLSGASSSTSIALPSSTPTPGSSWLSLFHGASVTKKKSGYA